MYVLLVQIKIKPEHRDAFVEAMLDDSRGSRTNEPGCLRFDVIQDASDRNTIYLYEVYRDEAAFQEHLKAPHFIKWRDTVKDWYAEPAVVFRGHNIDPSDAEWQ